MGVRVRFAPSPTGNLHVGGARTALFNYLFAKKNNGTFILRIEDTDKERSTLESEKGIYRILNWLGLSWQEGPSVGGDYGPYRQSERVEIYRKYAEKLIDEKKAYYCFCKPEKTSEKPTKPAPYPGTCRNLDIEESRKRIKNGEEYAIRFRIDEKEIKLRDELRGEINFDLTPLGDQILIRKDGFATYNFACAIDDGLMEITHVIRGDDHLSNTPKQVLYYKALGLKIPEFYHVSMILGEDGEKLSKRHGASSVEDFQNDGYLAETINNFLSLLGWSGGDNKEIYSLDELEKEFDLSRVSKSAAIFNMEKMKWMNGQHIRNLKDEEYLETAHVEFEKYFSNVEKETENKILLEIRKYLETLNDIKEKSEIFLEENINVDFENPEIVELFENELSLLGLEKFVEEFSSVEIPNQESIKPIFKKLGKEYKVKGPYIYKPLRLALTGMIEGPGIFGVLDILGKTKSINRIEKLISILKNR
jgi:glutamyl-tRNA synthetase